MLDRSILMHVSPALSLAVLKWRRIGIADLIYIAMQPLFIYFYSPRFGEFARKNAIHRRLAIALSVTVIFFFALTLFILYILYDVFNEDATKLRGTVLLFAFTAALYFLQRFVFSAREVATLSDAEDALQRLIVIKEFRHPKEKDKQVDPALFEKIDYRVVDHDSRHDTVNNVLDNQLMAIEANKKEVELLWKKSEYWGKVEYTR